MITIIIIIIDNDNNNTLGITSSSSINSSTVSGFFPRFLLIFLNSAEIKREKKNINKYKKRDKKIIQRHEKYQEYKGIKNK